MRLELCLLLRSFSVEAHQRIYAERSTGRVVEESQRALSDVRRTIYWFVLRSISSVRRLICAARSAVWLVPTFQ